MFAFIFLSLSLFLNLVTSCHASEKSEQALIAAVVNQHAITERELEMRLDFAIATLLICQTLKNQEIACGTKFYKT